MKKIIISILFLIMWFSQWYWCLVDCNYIPPITESRESDWTNCRYNDSEFCTKNYSYWNKIYSDNIENTTKIFNVGEIWINKYDFHFDYENDLTYNFWGWTATDKIYKTIYKISEKKNKIKVNKYLTISKFYESKYWNHAIYMVSPYVNNSENDFTEKEIEEGELELFKKYKNIVWLYIDDKKIWEYIIDWKSDYKKLEDFLVENKIMAFDYGDNYIYPKTSYVLKEKTIKILDNFVKKVEKIKYDKEKLLKKIDKIYNKYRVKEWKRNEFLSEVFLYLHTEILINKLKQDKSFKIKYNN